MSISVSRIKPMSECTGGTGMMVKQDNYGIAISLAVHLLIFVIPVSMVVVKQFKEIELLVMDETPPVKKVSEIKERIKEPQKEIEKPVEQKELIEPVVETKAPDAIVLPKPIEEPVQKKVEAQPAPAPKPSAPKDTEFGADFGPKFLHREMPQYPMIARKLGKEGRVVLRLTIDGKGNLINLEVIEKAGYGFTEAALEAVKKSTFLPAKKDGKSVVSRAILPIRFTLRRN